MGPVFLKMKMVFVSSFNFLTYRGCIIDEKILACGADFGVVSLVTFHPHVPTGLRGWKSDLKTEETNARKTREQGAKHARFLYAVRFAVENGTIDDFRKYTANNIIAADRRENNYCRNYDSKTG